MSEHVIVGAGAVGSAAALLLAERGEHVRIVSRRGSGPDHPAIERVAADATDAERLTELAAGAAALYNCASPLYHQWFTDWPPLARAFLAAAERSGAVLASMSNLYGYGPVDGPITHKTPLAATHPKLRLRAEMWNDQLAAQEAGRIRTTEVRASDYIEVNSILSTVIGKPLLAGKRQIPYPVMWVSGLFSPLIKELRTTRYQFTRPFVLDASTTTEMFGLQPIAMDEALRDAAARLRA
jgi:NAD(P)-dependent dehydrogenase (short-subunit alcohol dehydrogenase family)